MAQEVDRGSNMQESPSNNSFYNDLSRDDSTKSTDETALDFYSSISDSLLVTPKRNSAQSSQTLENADQNSPGELSLSPILTVGNGEKSFYENIRSSEYDSQDSSGSFSKEDLKKMMDFSEEYSSDENDADLSDEIDADLSDEIDADLSDEIDADLVGEFNFNYLSAKSSLKNEEDSLNEENNWDEDDSLNEEGSLNEENNLDKEDNLGSLKANALVSSYFNASNLTSDKLTSPKGNGSYDDSFYGELNLTQGKSDFSAIFNEESHDDIIKQLELQITSSKSQVNSKLTENNRDKEDNLGSSKGNGSDEDSFYKELDTTQDKSDFSAISNQKSNGDIIKQSVLQITSSKSQVNSKLTENNRDKEDNLGSSKGNGSDEDSFYKELDTTQDKSDFSAISNQKSNDDIIKQLELQITSSKSQVNSKLTKNNRDKEDNLGSSKANALPESSSSNEQKSTQGKSNLSDISNQKSHDDIIKQLKLQITSSKSQVNSKLTENNRDKEDNLGSSKANALPESSSSNEQKSTQGKSNLSDISNQKSHDDIIKQLKLQITSSKSQVNSKLREEKIDINRDFAKTSARSKLPLGQIATFAGLGLAGVGLILLASGVGAIAGLSVIGVGLTLTTVGMIGINFETKATTPIAVDNTAVERVKPSVTGSYQRAIMPGLEAKVLPSKEPKVSTSSRLLKWVPGALFAKTTKSEIASACTIQAPDNTMLKNESKKSRQVMGYMLPGMN
jgi:hypothetical protein